MSLLMSVFLLEFLCVFSIKTLSVYRWKVELDFVSCGVERNVTEIKLGFLLEICSILYL